MARTEHVRCRFVVKEDADGHPRLVLEPTIEAVAAFGDDLIALDLRDGTDPLSAERLARVLNHEVAGLSVTFLDRATGA